MTEGRVVKPLAVFVVVLVAILGATFLLAVLAPGGSGPPDGQSIDGQSPPQYQPDAVNAPVDPEAGEIEIDTDTNDRRILVDTGHENQVAERDLEPVTEAVFEADHTLEYGVSDGDEFADELDQYDGVLIIQPLQSYTTAERIALREYTDDGGRVVILAEPTQTRLSAGFGRSTATVSFGATDVLEQYDVRVGAERLYNMDDEATDNNFKSIYASPTEESDLSDGVETVNFDTAGYVATDGGVDTKFTAVEGTRTLETRRLGTYPTVVRNDNVVFVADTTFIRESDVYDADNEVFVGNLIEFLVTDEPSSPANGTATENGTDAESVTANGAVVAQESVAGHAGGSPPAAERLSPRADGDRSGATAARVREGAALRR